MRMLKLPMKTNPQTEERSAINYICTLKSKLGELWHLLGKKKKHFNLNFLDISQFFKPAKNEFRATNLCHIYSMKANVVSIYFSSQLIMFLNNYYVPQYCGGCERYNGKLDKHSHCPQNSKPIKVNLPLKRGQSTE